MNRFFPPWLTKGRLAVFLILVAFMILSVLVLSGCAERTKYIRADYAKTCEEAARARGFMQGMIYGLDVARNERAGSARFERWENFEPRGSTEASR